MSSRDLTTLVKNEIAGTTMVPVLMYEGEFIGGTLRLWTGQGTLVMSGQEWAGAGNLLTIAPVTETTDLRADGIEVTLTGMPSEILSTVLGSVVYGKPGRCYLALIETPSHIVMNVPGTQGNFASTPHADRFNVVGDLDVRALVEPDGGWGAAFGLINRSTTAALATYELAINSGAAYLHWTETGGTERQASVSVASVVGRKWIRATLDVDDGAGGHVVGVWTSDDNVTYTAIGSANAGAFTTSVRSMDASPIHLGQQSGTNFLDGQFHRAQVYDGIDGTLVADFNPTLDAQQGATSFQSSVTSETWTVQQSLSGSEIAELYRLAPTIIRDPYLSFRGKLDQPEINDAGAECSITVRYENNMIDLQRARVRHYTAEDQKIDWPDDKGFDAVAALQDKSFVWGPWKGTYL